jgi:hypothetical protein
LDYPIHEGPFPAKPISSGSYSGKGPSSGGGPSAGGSGSASPGYKGAFNSKQRRADYNAWVRGGNCFALDLPYIDLWVDEELALESMDDLLY